VCNTRPASHLKKSVANLSSGVQVKELIRSMKNFTIKAMCFPGWLCAGCSPLEAVLWAEGGGRQSAGMVLALT
jgi:hypothetical protein